MDRQSLSGGSIEGFRMGATHSVMRGGGPFFQSTLASHYILTPINTSVLLLRGTKWGQSFFFSEVAQFCFVSRS